MKKKEKKEMIKIKILFKNTPKGRSEIPEKAGSFELLDRYGKVVRTEKSNNIKKKVKEFHYDKNINFSFIKIKNK